MYFPGAYKTQEDVADTAATQIRTPLSLLQGLCSHSQLLHALFPTAAFFRRLRMEMGIWVATEDTAAAVSVAAFFRNFSFAIATALTLWRAGSA